MAVIRIEVKAGNEFTDNAEKAPRKIKPPFS